VSPLPGARAASRALGAGAPVAAAPRAAQTRAII